jgi:hypothetical protein
MAANDAAASLMGHTGRTQEKSYASFDQLGVDGVIRACHSFLGENTTLRRPSAAAPAQISESKIRGAMDDILGRKSNYTGDGQKQLIWHAANEKHKHCLANMGCGAGKSMAIYLDSTLG